MKSKITIIFLIDYSDDYSENTIFAFNSLFSWNLLLGEKEDTIQILQEQLGHQLDVDSKEELDKEELDKEELDKEELDKEEQAGLKEELDALAREEAGLNNLLFSITDALSTFQVGSNLPFFYQLFVIRYSCLWTA